MAVRVELFDPKVIDPPWLQKHEPQLRTLSEEFCQTVEGGWCQLPKHIDMYSAIVIAIDHVGQDEKVVGFAAALGFDYDGYWAFPAAMLDANYRGQQIGSTMTHALIDHAIARGAQIIRVDTENEKMIEFFTKNGFRRNGNQFALDISPSEDILKE